jgi:RND family efflux transporter MFP subunit
VWAPSFLILTGFVSGCGAEPPPQSVPRQVYALQIVDANALAERSFPGRARAGQEVNSSFRVSGPLIEFPVDVGDELKAGELLARIDPRDFVNRLNALIGQLEREIANQTRASADLRRIENIRRKDPGATSESIVDRRRQLSASADAAVRSLEASVESARDQLSYTYLNAPFDGVIVDKYVENFETVLARQPILRLLNPSSIEMIVQVPENLISLAPYVEAVSVTFDALSGIEVSADIKEIGREATQSTRTFPVTLVMDQPEGAEILPGMAGSATIISRPPDDSGLVGIEVPMTAVFTGEEAGKKYVWIIDADHNTLSRTEVTLGVLTRIGVMIDTGIGPGDTIVTKGVHTLSEGETVRILDAGLGRAS